MVVKNWKLNYSKCLAVLAPNHARDTSEIPPPRGSELQQNLLDHSIDAYSASNQKIRERELAGEKAYL